MNIVLPDSVNLPLGYLRGTMHVLYGNRKSLYSKKTVKRRQVSNFNLYYDQS